MLRRAASQVSVVAVVSVMGVSAPGARAAEQWTSAPSAVSAESAPTHRHPRGWTFRVPDGWRVKDVTGASALAPPDTDYDPARTDLVELYAVAAHRAIDPEDPRSADELRIALIDAGLRPSAHFRKEALTERGRPIFLYAWWGRPARHAVMLETRVYLVPVASAALLLVAAGERDLLANHDGELRRLASSLMLDSRGSTAMAGDWGLTRPAPPGPGTPDPPGAALADDSARSQRWLYYLRDKRLTPLARGEGGSQPALYLAPDGTFQSSGTGRVAAAAGVPNGAISPGLWRIVSQGGVTSLVLHEPDGQTRYLPLVQQDGRTYVGGSPTSVTEAAVRP